VTLYNACGFQVDPAFFPGALHADSTPTGGFALAAGASAPVVLPDSYAGRVWARTGCNSTGFCATGTCSAGGENCTAPAPGGGAKGQTLAQLNMNSCVVLGAEEDLY
jgi:hypothetical protein